MAKKRFTDIEIWDREWYMELKPVHKCLMKYIFDKCDASGCWKPNWKLASLHIGENVTFADLSYLPKHQYEILENGKIFIPDFIKFQYGKLSEKSPAHNPVFLAIENNNLSNRVLNRVCNTPKEKDIDIDKEKEMEKEEEEEKERATISENSLISKMIKIWKNNIPKYPFDNSKDLPAIREVSMFICDQSGINFYAKKEKDNESIFLVWENISKFVAEDDFYRNYSLSQVSKHIQNISQKFRNGKQDNKNGKSGVGKINGQQINEAFTKFYQ